MKGDWVQICDKETGDYWWNRRLGEVSREEVACEWCACKSNTGGEWYYWRKNANESAVWQLPPLALHHRLASEYIRHLLRARGVLRFLVVTAPDDPGESQSDAPALRLQADRGGV